MAGVGRGGAGGAVGESDGVDCGQRDGEAAGDGVGVGLAPSDGEGLTDGLGDTDADGVGVAWSTSSVTAAIVMSGIF